MFAFLSTPFIYYTHSLDQCTNPCYQHLWQCVCVCMCVSESVCVPLWAHWGESEVNVSMCPLYICDFWVHQVSPFPPIAIVMFMNTLLLTSELNLEEKKKFSSCRTIYRTKFKRQRDRNALNTMLCVSLLTDPLYSVPVWCFWPTLWCLASVLKLFWN